MESEGSIRDRAAALKAEYARLRSLLVNASAVDVLRVGGDVWLCDEVVLYRATGNPAVAELDPGWYRLVASGAKAGFQLRGVPMHNLPAWFANVDKSRFYEAYATGWSITKHKAKAMLVVVEVDMATAAKISVIEQKPIADRFALAMNESVWWAYRAQYKGHDVRLWHSGYGGPFKITVDGQTIAYVEPIRIPKKRQEGANLLADATKPEDEQDEDEDEEP